MKVLNNALPEDATYDHVENFVIAKEVLTPEECDKIVKHAKSFGLEDAGVVLRNHSVETIEHDEEIRNSKITFLDFENSNNMWIFQKIVPRFVGINDNHFKFDIVGFQEAFQFTEYNAPSGHYGDHTDKLLKGNVRKLSLVIQLSNPDDYEGGELQLMLGGEPFTVPKEQGSMVVFPSYILHRVTPTTKGTRHTLVGWSTGAPFK